MKKILAISALLMSLGYTTFAQETTTDDPKKKLKGKERLLIGVTLDNWMNTPSYVETKIFSPGFNVAGMYDYPLGRSSFSLAGGLGFSSYNIHSNATPKTKLDDNFEPESTYLDTALPSGDYKINKLSLNYVEVPVEFRFRSRGDKSYRRFSMAAGFKFGYLVQSHTKYKDDNIKIKLYYFDFLNNLRYGPTFRIGYGKVSLFGFYSLTDIFEDGKGPAITPFSAGILIVPY